jgi:ABC-type antimicrobial peptide transport system permease subunit
MAAQRRREIGVRVALGAGRGNILRLVVGHGLRPVLTGLLLGLTGAVAMSRLISSLLFETSPTDPATLAGASGVLVLVSLVAAYLPAKRALAVDPVSALRAE